MRWCVERGVLYQTDLDKAGKSESMASVRRRSGFGMCFFFFGGWCLDVDSCLIFLSDANISEGTTTKALLTIQFFGVTPRSFRRRCNNLCIL